MSKKKNRHKYENYLDFLETRLNSPNFLKNASKEEIEKTKEKYKREKFRQRILNTPKKNR